MKLEFKVHLDDYHSNITAHWRTERAAVAHVQEEIDGGYDVTNITLDGQPLDLTPFCTNREGIIGLCRNRAETGHALCIVHRHQAEYNAHSAAGRYQGD